MDHKKIMYITKCGCKVYVEGTKRKTGYSRVCREHEGRVLSAERECFACDVIIPLGNTGKGPFRCDKHLAEHKSKLRHKNYVKKCLKPDDVVPVNKKPVRGKWSFDKRGDYCTWLKSCLGSGPLECNICRKFVGVFMGHDPQSLEQFTV